MKDQIAVFIDAVYLYAFGSLALTGDKLPRVRVGVKPDALFTEVKVVVADVAPGKQILRIYWYDIASSNRLHEEAQMSIGSVDGFKLRPVALHNHIVKTAAASMIVKDATELARNHAISDAIIVARNDTLRPGVEICQQNGVRVHLLEIFKDSRSRFSRLQTDVDSCRKWTRDELNSFLFEQDLPAQESEGFYSNQADRPFEQSHAPGYFRPDEVSEQVSAMLERAVNHYVENLYDDQIESCVQFWHSGRAGVPSDHDKGLLSDCRNELDRNLSTAERLAMRNVFREVVTERAHDAGISDEEGETYEFEDMYEEDLHEDDGER